MESEIGEEVVLSSYQSLWHLELNPTGKVWDVVQHKHFQVTGEGGGSAGQRASGEEMQRLAVRVRSAGSEIKAEGM